MANITLLPSAKVPLVYDGELTMTTEWYRFFWNIYGFTGTGVVPVSKGGTGLTSIGEHQLIIGNSLGLFEKTELVGSGITITYAPGTTTLAIGNSGVTPGTYGSASAVGQFQVDIHGTLVFAQNVPIAIDATQIISGTIASARISGSYTGITGVGTLTTGTWNATTIGVGYGGTGQSTYTDGQLLIGNTTGNTLTKATLTAGTGISVTNGAGSITIGNTGVLSVSGTAPVVSSGGATPAISMAAANTTTNGYLTSTDWNTFNNKAPATSGTSILYGNGSGGFSNVTIGSGISFAGGTLSATGSGGTVTSVTGTSPVVSSGGTTPAINLATAYGDTLNPYASKTANYFLAAPNGSAGVPTFRAIVAADVPALAYVTSVSGTGTVNGITLTGTVTSSGSLTLGGTLGGIANSQLTNSTISGVSLGGNLFSLTAGTGVSFSAGTTYNGSAAITITATGSGGTVTSVTGTAPVVSSGGATPAISMAAANTTTNGYLTSTDWNTFNGKGAGSVTSVSGTGTVNGISISGTVTTSGNLTLGGTLSGVSLTSQVSGTLAVGNGGTGITTTPSNGQIPVGNGTNYTAATITAGTNIAVTNGAGSISVATNIPVPQVTTYTSGSGTYTVPANTKYLIVEMCGGGGGGSGAGLTGWGGYGVVGGNTTFGTTLLVANGGNFGGPAGGSSVGGTGGTASLGGVSGLAITGGGGTGTSGVAAFSFSGWPGGANAFGGSGTANYNGVAAGAANTGAGGSGGSTSNGYNGSSGGAGGYVKATLTSLSSTYSYAVGAGGAGGTAGTNGTVGSAGGSGVIIITAYF